MKEWWTTKAWPWLRENWRWVLFPIGILLLVLEVLTKMRGPAVVTVDPTEKADERARTEAELLKKQQDAEAARLAAQEKKIADDAAKERDQRAATQAAEVQELREDPEELKRRMLATGKL